MRFWVSTCWHSGPLYLSGAPQARGPKLQRLPTWPASRLWHVLSSSSVSLYLHTDHSITYGLLGTGNSDHLDFHTAPELCHVLSSTLRVLTEKETHSRMLWRSQLLAAEETESRCLEGGPEQLARLECGPEQLARNYSVYSRDGYKPIQIIIVFLAAEWAVHSMGSLPVPVSVCAVLTTRCRQTEKGAMTLRDRKHSSPLWTQAKDCQWPGFHPGGPVKVKLMCLFVWFGLRGCLANLSWRDCCNSVGDSLTTDWLQNKDTPEPFP